MLRPNSLLGVRGRYPPRQNDQPAIKLGQSHRTRAFLNIAILPIRRPAVNHGFPWAEPVALLSLASAMVPCRLPSELTSQTSLKGLQSGVQPSVAFPFCARDAQTIPTLGNWGRLPPALLISWGKLSLGSKTDRSLPPPRRCWVALSCPTTSYAHLEGRAPCDDSSWPGWL